MDGFFLGFIRIFISGLTDLLSNSPLFYFIGVICVFSAFLLLRRIISWR